MYTTRCYYKEIRKLLYYKEKYIGRSLQKLPAQALLAVQQRVLG